MCGYMEKLSQKKIEQNSTILFDSVGCKLNKYELEVMRAQSETLGMVPLVKQKTGDVVVLNTCSVTNSASADSRRMIRKYRKHNENAYIVVTGCYSQTDLDEVKELGVDLILNNMEKAKFFDIIKKDINDLDELNLQKQSIMSSVKFQSRPFLKIQDGCDAYCSYCIIPRARGRSRSVDKKEVLSQIEELSKTYPELVITGVNLGQYEQEKDYGLLALLKDMVAIDTVKKLRISSLEPNDLTPEFLNFMVENDKICKHIHLPLQGGEDQLLKDMRRNYTIEQYSEKLKMARKLCPQICLGADIMVGFPTESESCFDKVKENLLNLEIDYFHVFTFSARDKTVANNMQEKVEPQIKKERNRWVTSLSSKRKKDFLERHIGKTFDAVVERGGKTKGFMKALTDNYIPVIFETTEDLALKFVKIRIDEVGTDKVFGTLLKVY
ncbi:MAG: tRNA (N(6)-L-threonylcarbamoyladenosine(37)-C(2))-methylthiotransferase MtaB [Candidatus Cloacimonadota bacterium]|nr:MAG: tRNA (N(6)-L-threonylcarbamoyladenosine(37)-C(2))-methylthiotransferase MtaB [Candidatus Cloacimonadota bacterium]